MTMEAQAITRPRAQEVQAGHLGFTLIWTSDLRILGYTFMLFRPRSLCAAMQECVHAPEGRLAVRTHVSREQCRVWSWSPCSAGVC